MRNATCLLIIVLAGQSFDAAASGGSDSTIRKSKVAYYFTVGMGTMIGCENCKSQGPKASFSFSTVHGVRIGRRASVGVGFGYDSYERWNALPVFGSATWDLIGSKNRFYVQLNYGYSSAWLNDWQRDFGYTGNRGGKMINPLVGYRIKSGNTSITVSMGYKFQRAYATYSYPTAYYPYYYDFVPAPPSTKEVRTDMERFVIGISIGWK